jgi:hypothetical protein
VSRMLERDPLAMFCGKGAANAAKRQGREIDWRKRLYQGRELRKDVSSEGKGKMSARSKRRKRAWKQRQKISVEADEVRAGRRTLKCRSRVLRNLTLSLASTYNLLSSLYCTDENRQNGGQSGPLHASPPVSCAPVYFKRRNVGTTDHAKTHMPPCNSRQLRAGPMGMSQSSASPDSPEARSWMHD